MAHFMYRESLCSSETGSKETSNQDAATKVLPSMGLKGESPAWKSFGTPALRHAPP